LSALKTLPVEKKLAIEGTLNGADGRISLAVEPTTFAVLEPHLRVKTGVSFAKPAESAVMVVHSLGKGRTVMLNFSLIPILEARAKSALSPLAQVLDALVISAGIRPPCELRRADGTPPVCTQRIRFTDGNLTYLALQQDFLMPHLPEQKNVRVTLPTPAFVYDLRAGKPIGRGKISEWEVTLSRANPLVYSLLPYQVTKINLLAPPAATRGNAVKPAVAVSVSAGKPEFHVVRLNLYAPGQEAPHRQYSQNIACPAGRGVAKVPFALNDPLGDWRMELRDVASGMSVHHSLRLKN